MDGVLYDFESLADGTPLTPTNSGATQINPGSGTCKALADAAAHGGIGARMARGTATDFTIGRWPVDADNTVMAFGGAFRVSALNTGFCNIRHASGNEFIVTTSATGALVVGSGANSTITAGLAANTRYWLSLNIDTTAGTCAVNIWDATGQQNLVSTSVSITADARPIASADLGCCSGSVVFSTDWDAIQFIGGQTTPVLPLENIPPAPTNLEVYIGGLFVPAIERARIGGSWVAVTEKILTGTVPASDTYSDTYSDIY